jgi:ethanolamine-phosphate cytidylyltransferase
LSVLGCRYVDDVLIDAPYEISSEIIASLRIAEVVHGTCDTDGEFCSKEDERYRHAKDRGIFYPLKNPCSFSLKTIFERVQRNQETFRKRFERKMSSEAQHYMQKYSTGAKG